MNTQTPGYGELFAERRAHASKLVNTADADVLSLAFEVTRNESDLDPRSATAESASCKSGGSSNRHYLAFVRV